MAKKASKPKRKKIAVDQDFIPFVPAYDLLEQAELNPSAEEIAAIATALTMLLPSDPAQCGIWQNTARNLAISQRR